MSLRVGPPGTELHQQRVGLGREVRVELAAAGDEVPEERQPVTVVRVEAVPRRQARAAPRPVAEQRRLAEAGLRDDQGDAGPWPPGRASR